MKLFSLLFLLLASLFPLVAQTAKPANKAPYSMRMLCVDVAAQASKLIVAEKTDKGWVAKWRLSVSSSYLTDPLGFNSRKLALAIDPAAPAANGDFNGPAVVVKEELLVTPFYEFELPDSDTVTAVMIATNEPKGNPYRVILLDTKTQRFGEGKILIQNFTKNTIAGLLGGKSAKLEAGQSIIIEPGIDQAADMAQITLAKQVGDIWEPFCDTRWPGKVDYRRYLLLIPRADGTIHPFVMPEYPPYR